MPRDCLHNEQELLRRTAKGDEKAFAQLFEQYADTLYGTALHYTKIPESAEEIVQDVFVKIWIKRENLPTIHRFNDYLFIVTRNNILNFLKKNSRERNYREQLTLHFQESATTPEQEMLFKESGALIAHAVATLPPQQQTVYEMRRNQGLSLDEIADRMQLSRNTVRNHLNRALLRVRDFLQTYAAGIVLLISMLQVGLG